MTATGGTAPAEAEGKLLRRRRGETVLIAGASSGIGQELAVYCATKAYVLSFTEAPAEEVRGSGVRVSCLAPGATDTGFAAQAGLAGTRLFRRGVMDAGRVAQAGRDGLQRGKTLIIPGLRNRVLAFSVRLSPRAQGTTFADVKAHIVLSRQLHDRARMMGLPGKTPHSGKGNPHEYGTQSPQRPGAAAGIRRVSHC